VNPALFLNRVFQMAALNNYAEMLDGHALIFDDVADTGCPEAGVEAWRAATTAGESPNVCKHPEDGWFATHGFRGDPEDEPMRMVCWAEMGGEKFNQRACDWWKAQGANPDTIEPGITDLHRQKPEPEPTEPVEKPSREFAVEFIGGLGKMNPSGDRHGSIDPPFTKMCRDFDPERQTKTPLTLEEWKGLTRDSDDMDKPFGRDILDATDPLVFLAVLRDRLVFTSGAAGNIIRMISIVVDPHIEAHSMTWRA
jgi:hypothetical protein